MTFWEYCSTEDWDRLEELGREGWEAFALISYTYTSNHDEHTAQRFYLKRRILKKEWQVEIPHSTTSRE